MKKLFLLVLFFLSLASYAAAIQPLPADEAFQFSSSAKDNQTILLRWKIAPNYYLYEKHFSFTVLKSKNVLLGNPLYPSDTQTLQTALGTFSVYANTLIVPIPIIRSPEKNILLEVNYQGCSKAGYCYPPTKKIASINLENNYMQWTQALRIDIAPAKQTAEVKSHDFLPLILSFFGFGVLLSLTPCVLPMIPILSSIIVGQKNKKPRHLFSLSLFYVLGMAITYAVIGVLFALIGKNVQLFFQQSSIMIAFSIFFVIMALSLFGLFQFQLPEKIRDKIAKKTDHQKGGTYFGVTMMGCLSTLVLSPCVTPPLVAALGIISQTGNMALGGFALFSMGFGMGVPLLLIGALGKKILPKPGRWMNVIKNSLGIVLLIMAIMMFQRAEPDLFHIPFFTQKTAQSALPFQMVTSIEDVNSALIAADKENKPVLLDFYANWCTACKELDALTLRDADVKAALSGYVLLRVDITKDSQSNQILEQHYGVIAPPTILFFKAKKEIPHSRVIGYQSPKTFLAHLKTLK